jgi:hypothetical protein
MNFYELWEHIKLQESTRDYFPELYKILDKHPDAYVHFTDGMPGAKGQFTSKLGFNVDPAHQDPIAIYAFPAHYDFGGNQHFLEKRFIYVLKLKPGINIVSLGKLTEKEALLLLGKVGLTDKYKDRRRIYGKKVSPGEIFYKTVQNASGGGFDRNVAWNRYLKQMGIDALEDEGAGIIHTAEKHQIALLKPGTYDIIALVENKIPDERIYDRLAYRIANTIAVELLGPNYQFRKNPRPEFPNTPKIYLIKGHYAKQPITIEVKYSTHESMTVRLTAWINNQKKVAEGIQKVPLGGEEENIEEASKKTAYIMKKQLDASIADTPAPIAVGS